jgi:Fe2+ or Zn2+ uptake regulation protein
MKLTNLEEKILKSMLEQRMKMVHISGGTPSWILQEAKKYYNCNFNSALKAFTSLEEKGLITERFYGQGRSSYHLTRKGLKLFPIQAYYITRCEECGAKSPVQKSKHKANEWAYAHNKETGHVHIPLQYVSKKD